jgi:transcriptional regulator with XRE-family HTH domain
MRILGDNIKKQREKSEITLKELAHKTGLSSSFLSQVESGKAAPSLSTAKKIADVLGTTVGYLIGEESKSNNHLVTLIRKDERKSLVNFGYGLVLQFLSTLDKNHTLEPSIHVIEENATSGTPPYQHKGEEILFILEGSVKVRLGEDDYLMNEGDSIHFKSMVPHSILNTEKEIAKVLCVSTPPFF